MLKVENISFSYHKKETITDISFTLQKGATLALIGESGCGKSTLLKCIYGLYDLDKGTIYWNDSQILGPKYNLIPGMEYMKYLAQDFDLMPYITVAENVGKYLSNIYKDKKQQRIQELLELVEMTDYANVKVQFLSGGQMQRVALARVLALEPKVLLLDEPFSHIDNFRKNNLRRKLFNYVSKNQITTIIATHDSNDVLSFCDEVIVLKNGKTIKQGTPQQLFESRDNLYTASLLGEINQVKIDGEIRLIHPHQIQIVEFSNVKALVVKCYYRGSYYLVEALIDSQTVYFNSLEKFVSGATIYLNIGL